MKRIYQADRVLQLQEFAARRGALLEEKSPGHFQIKGRLLVNYYPLSKSRTAYVDGTTEGIDQCEPEQAVAMAFKAPQVVTESGVRKDERSHLRVYRRWRIRQWKDGNRRCWLCHGLMTIAPNTPDSFTVDHRIPLHRGGLDNPNNWRGAHARCNHNRGHNMPELKTAPPEHWVVPKPKRINLEAGEIGHTPRTDFSLPTYDGRGLPWEE